MRANAGMKSTQKVHYVRGRVVFDCLDGWWVWEQNVYDCNSDSSQHTLIWLCVAIHSLSSLESLNVRRWSGNLPWYNCAPSGVLGSLLKHTSINMALHSELHFLEGVEWGRECDKESFVSSAKVFKSTWTICQLTGSTCCIDLSTYNLSSKAANE